MDCNTAIVWLSSAHVVTIGIFAGYRIIIRKHFAKLEKSEEELKKRVEELERKQNKNN